MEPFLPFYHIRVVHLVVPTGESLASKGWAKGLFQIPTGYGKTVQRQPTCFPTISNLPDEPFADVQERHHVADKLASQDEFREERVASRVDQPHSGWRIATAVLGMTSVLIQAS